MGEPNSPAPVGPPLSLRVDPRKPSQAFWGLCCWRGAYSHGAPGPSGFCPLDRDRKRELFSLTPGVVRLTGSAAARLSFAESRGLWREWGGVEVSPKQVERAAEALGAEMAVDEHPHVGGRDEAAPTL